MTVELYTPPAPFTIQGTGPYAITAPYAQASDLILRVETSAATVVTLDPAEWSITPASALDGSGGDITLSGAVATTYAGRRLFIERDTGVQQGWAGIQGAREKALETQLDVVVLAVQDLQVARDRALRGLTAIEPLPALVPALIDVLQTLLDEFPDGFVNAASRAGLVAHLATGAVLVDGTFYLLDGHLYQVRAGATLIPDLPGLVPVEPVTPQHFGAVGDGVTDDRAAFAAADLAGVTLHVPVPPVAYTMSSPLTMTRAVVRPDPRARWGALTDDGALQWASRPFDGDDGYSAERFAGRVFVGASAPAFSGADFPGMARSWIGLEAGGFMTYFESRAQAAVTSTFGGVALSASSRSSDNDRTGEVAAIGGGFYATNDKADPADLKSAWAVYGHAVHAQPNRFTTSLELDTTSLQPVVEVNPYSTGVTGTTAVAWLGVGGETAQRRIQQGQGATLQPVSCAVAIVNTANDVSAPGNRFQNGIVIANQAILRSGGDTGRADAIALARQHEITWRYSGGANAYAGIIRAEATGAQVHQRVVLGTGAFEVRGVRSDLVTEEPLFTVLAPEMGANAVNYVFVAPQLSGQGFVQIGAAGPDTNIDLLLQTKGTGRVRLSQNAVVATTPASFSATRILQIKDATGTVYHIPAALAAW